MLGSGRRGERGEWMRRLDEKIGCGLYQSCGNRGSVGRVSVFGLRWCRWVGAWTRVWRGRVVLCLCDL